jgi:Lon protease-like protein
VSKEQKQLPGEGFSLPFGDLPEVLPVFPLQGAMLLPQGRMPLNIFEPRYLNMVIDSLKNSRHIGMVQPLVTRPGPSKATQKLFSIGCAGRISAFAETDDGRIMLTLQGICRFEILEEIESNTLYRQVKPDFRGFEQDLSFQDTTIDREKLIEILRDYLNLKDININLNALEKTTDAFLIATLGMIIPFNDGEKQTIMEARDLIDIVEMMVALMEIELATQNRTSTRH